MYCSKRFVHGFQMPMTTTMTIAKKGSQQRPTMTVMSQQLDSEMLDSYTITTNYEENALLLSGVGIVPQQQLLVKDDLLLATAVPYYDDTNIANNDSVVLEPSIQLETTPTSDTASTTVESNPTISSPGLRKIVLFAIPAMGIWLCNPILSLIDTSSVGLLAGTAHQAALSPAVAVVDYSALLLGFMYTGTTNLIAASVLQDQGLPSDQQHTTASTLITSLQLSLLVGTVYGILLFLLSHLLLTWIIGVPYDEFVFQTALKYVRIRSLGMPAAAVLGSAQAACMGMQDLKSPLAILGSAAIVNFLGDVLLVARKHPWIGGACGAAWATVFSQFAAVGFFLSWLVTSSSSSKPKSMNTATTQQKEPFPFQSRLAMILPTKWKRNNNNNNAMKEVKDGMVSTKGFLHARRRHIFGLPSANISMQFLPYVIPIVTTSIGRVSSYVAMSHVVSSTFGTVAMAAQQVIVSIFYCLCPVADSLNLCAQSLVPAIFQHDKMYNTNTTTNDKKTNVSTLKQTSNEFLQAGGIFGAILVAITSVVPFVTPFFTSDTVVVDQVKNIVPFLAAAFSVHGMIAASEGVLLGQSDLGFLGKAYASFFFAVPWMMLRIKKNVLPTTKNHSNLSSVWRVFVTYQLVRSVIFFARVRMLANNNKAKKSQNV